jgi:tetratricopeptide (TPR) repeat protein
MKEIDDVNATRMLRFLVQLSNADITLTDEATINRHFQSIDYYNSYLATHTPRAIDYFGRAMDFAMLRDYTSAINDLNKALELTPDFALGYFARGVARYNSLKVQPAASSSLAQVELRAIIADFDRAIELSPRMAFAYYNKGNVLAETGDYTSALYAYNKAIELKVDFGEAYYNRGYVFFQLGDSDNGTANLSKAGELGIMPSYNLLKRMH